MKTLILGGNGFLGSHLVDFLLKSENEVVVFDKNNEIFREQLPNVKYYLGDLSNTSLLATALNGVDIVYHLISTTLPKSSNDAPIYDVESNLVGTLKMLDLCVKSDVKKIIFLSSGGTVYGQPESLPISESSNTQPDCSYGICKLAIEKYLYLYKKLYGLNYTVIRASNPYGPRQNYNVAQGVISVFLSQIIQNKEITIWGDGNITRDYIYIDDCIQAIFLASVTDTNSKIFNIGSGIGHSLNDIVRLISEICKLTPIINYRTKRLSDVSAIYLNIENAKEELNWYPGVHIQEGIEKTYLSIKKLFY